MSLRKGQNKDVIIGSKKVRHPARDVLTVFYSFNILLLEIVTTFHGIDCLLIRSAFSSEVVTSPQQGTSITATVTLRITCREIKKPFPEYKKVNIECSAFPKINFTCCRPPKQSRIKKQKRQTSVFLSHVPVFLPVYSRNAPAHKRYSASAAFAACGECVTMITHRFSL